MPADASAPRSPVWPLLPFAFVGAMTGGGAPAKARFVDALRWLPGGLRSGGAHRARWGIFDQGISSFTNFAITAVVAHQVSPTGFGAFSVALAMYVCVLWVARSLVGEPFVVRLTSASFDLQTAAAREALGTAVATGAATGLAAVVLGLSIRGPTGSALAAMGLFLPCLLAQDAYRYVLMARGRARAAAANDGLWLAVQGLVIAALLLAGRDSVATLVIAFGAGATVAAMFGGWQTGVLPAVNRARPWLRAHADLWLPFVLELLTVNATPQLSMLAVAALGEVVTVGEVRAGMFLFAPLSVLFSGLFLIGLPEAVRLRQRSLPGLRVFVVALAVGGVALTSLWAAALWLLPGDAGRAALRSNWATGRHLLWPMAAFTAAGVVTMAAIIGLRALEVARRSIRVRIWAGPVVFGAGVAGAEIAGASGAAIGLAASSWLSAALAWLVLTRAWADAGQVSSGGGRTDGRDTFAGPPVAGPADLLDGVPLVVDWA